MIQFKINADDLLKELETKYQGIQELTSRETKTQLAKAIFTITTKKFLRDFSLEAATNPSEYSHLYEFGSNWASRYAYVGTQTKHKRLFRLLRKSVNYGALTIDARFLPAHQRTPIPPQLQTGKRQVKFSGIFKDKASVIDNNKPISFTTKNYIAFLSSHKETVKFVSPGKNIKILHPGGTKANHAFQKFFEIWFDTKATASVEDSGMIEQLSRTTAKVLESRRAGRQQVRQAVYQVTKKYSQDKVEI